MDEASANQEKQEVTTLKLTKTDPPTFESLGVRIPHIFDMPILLHLHHDIYEHEWQEGVEFLNNNPDSSYHIVRDNAPYIYIVVRAPDGRFYHKSYLYDEIHYSEDPLDNPVRIPGRPSQVKYTPFNESTLFPVGSSHTLTSGQFPLHDDTVQEPFHIYNLTNPTLHNKSYVIGGKRVRIVGYNYMCDGRHLKTHGGRPWETGCTIDVVEDISASKKSALLKHFFNPNGTKQRNFNRNGNRISGGKTRKSRKKSKTRKNKHLRKTKRCRK